MHMSFQTQLIPDTVSENRSSFPDHRLLVPHLHLAPGKELEEPPIFPDGSQVQVQQAPLGLDDDGGHVRRLHYRRLLRISDCEFGISDLLADREWPTYNNRFRIGDCRFL